MEQTAHANRLNTQRDEWRDAAFTEGSRAHGLAERPLVAQVQPVVAAALANAVALGPITAALALAAATTVHRAVVLVAK